LTGATISHVSGEREGRTLSVDSVTAQTYGLGVE
jgi:hypothetical protein